jgi:AcrR family transcriptional regulator
MPESTATPRWHRRKDARPGEILDAALDVFVRQGFAATRIQDLAQQAGVTAGTIYLYFPSKEVVFHAAITQAMSSILTLSEQRVDAHEGTAESLLVELLRRWWKTTAADSRLAGIPRLISAEADRFPDLAHHYVTEVLGRARAIFARVLRRGIERGEFRPLDVEYAARLVMAPVQYAFAYNSSFAAYDAAGGYDRGYLDAHLELFLRGIRAAAPPDDERAAAGAPITGMPPPR